jgi:hypothetical protein
VPVRAYLGIPPHGGTTNEDSPDVHRGHYERAAEKSDRLHFACDDANLWAHVITATATIVMAGGREVRQRELRLSGLSGLSRLPMVSWLSRISGLSRLASGSGWFGGYAWGRPQPG